jgi:hypothetical protein
MTRFALPQEDPIAKIARMEERRTVRSHKARVRRESHQLSGERHDRDHVHVEDLGKST